MGKVAFIAEAGTVNETSSKPKGRNKLEKLVMVGRKGFCCLSTLPAAWILTE